MGLWGVFPDSGCWGQRRSSAPPSFSLGLEGRWHLRLDQHTLAGIPCGLRGRRARAQAWARSLQRACTIHVYSRRMKGSEYGIFGHLGVPEQKTERSLSKQGLLAAGGDGRTKKELVCRGHGFGRGSEAGSFFFSRCVGARCDVGGILGGQQLPRRAYQRLGAVPYSWASDPKPHIQASPSGRHVERPAAWGDLVSERAAEKGGLATKPGLRVATHWAPRGLSRVRHIRWQGTCGGGSHLCWVSAVPGVHKTLSLRSKGASLVSCRGACLGAVQFRVGC